MLELLIVVGIIALIAAIAIPSLLRARMSADEASAIASLRTINSSQQAFSTSCGKGSFVTVLTDLAIPASAGGAPFISPDLSGGAPRVEKSGYAFEIRRGTDSTVAVDPSCNGIAAAALASGYFAFADPIARGTSGVRFFWTNTLGTIYFDSTSTLSGETLGASTPGGGEAVQ
jgi:type II secretory pathway pseudopilin PulG